MADVAMAQIDRQGEDLGVEFFLALAIPAQQALDGEGVAQIVQPGVGSLILPAQLVAQRPEGSAHLPIGKPLTVSLCPCRLRNSAPELPLGKALVRAAK